MKKQTLLALLIGTVALTQSIPVKASDVDDILNQISGESSSGKNSSLKKVSVSDSSSGSTSSQVVHHKKKSQSSESAAPSIKIWNPKDKLPSDISGQGVAGNFAFYGTSSEANPILIPAEDANNPFARQFWIVNLQDQAGPNALVPIGQRHMVQVSSKRPLIFVGRGILPGVYNVQVQ